MFSQVPETPYALGLMLPPWLGETTVLWFIEFGGVLHFQNTRKTQIIRMSDCRNIRESEFTRSPVGMETIHSFR